MAPPAFARAWPGRRLLVHFTVNFLLARVKFAVEFQAHMNPLMQGIGLTASTPPEELHRQQSAQEFVMHTAGDLQIWLKMMKDNGRAYGKRWLFVALLNDGSRMIVHELSASGFSLVRLVGQTHGGFPAILLAHKNTVQFMAYFGPEVPVDSVREIGFHTGKDLIKVG